MTPTSAYLACFPAISPEESWPGWICCSAPRHC